MTRLHNAGGEDCPCGDCGQIPVEELRPQVHATDAEMLAEVADQIGHSRALRARLDAEYQDRPALGRRRAARPLVCTDHWITFGGCQICELTRERDEARAELEDLRVQLAHAETEHADACLMRLGAARIEAARFAQAIGEIDAVLGLGAPRPLADTVADVRRLVADRDAAVASARATQDATR